MRTAVNRLTALLGVSVLVGAGLILGCGGGDSTEERTAPIFIKGEILREVHLKTLKDSEDEDEMIEKVANAQACAFGTCAVTDSDGEFLIEAPLTFNGGTFEITVLGDGIDGKVKVFSPAQIEELEVELLIEDDEILVAKVEFDGIEDKGQAQVDFNDGD